MGKKDFGAQYRAIKEQLARDGKPLSIKISGKSNTFDSSKEYAGVIIYHWEGLVQWHNSKIGHKGRSFYVYLVDTTTFAEEEFREAGQGRVHHTAVQRIMGIDFEENRACLGGFSVRKGETNYSSVWLNQKSSSAFPLHWEEDGNKEMSEGEKRLVDLAVQEWKAKGTNIVVEIPPETDSDLLSSASVPARPAPSGGERTRASAPGFERRQTQVPRRTQLHPGAVQVHCPNGHALTRWQGRVSTTLRAACDDCHRRELVSAWQCAACDYDLCQVCFTRKGDPTGPWTPPLFPPRGG